MSNILRVLPLTVLLVVAGCSESPAPAAAPVAPVAATTAAPAAPTPAPVVAAPVATTTVASVTGVPECDQFLAAYESCLSAKVPAESRAAMQTGLDSWKQSWTTMAADPNTRAAMPQMCAQAQTSSAAALQAYGCTL